MTKIKINKMKDSQNQIKDKFDSVIFLTSSNWFEEPRSNRYHFASRFAALLPTFFVQFDTKENKVEIEETEINNLTLIRINESFAPSHPSVKMNERALATALRTINGFVGDNLLAWCYNTFCGEFLDALNPRFSVYHATEIYLGSPDNNLHEFDASSYAFFKDNICSLLEQSDLIFAVSDGVYDSLSQTGLTSDKMFRNYNGVDAEYWLSRTDQVIFSERPIALYQGGVNKRLDFDLILETCKALPSWDFAFLGGQNTDSERWREILALSNVKSCGHCGLEEVALKARCATVGWVPFRQYPELVTSMPLKMYEYVACGLPVLSIPISGLLGESEDLFRFATTPEEFVEKFKQIRLEDSRTNPDKLLLRKSAATANSYDKKFGFAVQTILEKLQSLSAKEYGDKKISIEKSDEELGVNGIIENKPSPVWRDFRERVGSVENLGVGSRLMRIAIETIKIVTPGWVRSKIKKQLLLVRSKQNKDG